RQGRVMSSNMVDRISKLLNQAERADEGSPEREAFMERAMTLSQAHSIDLAVARSHTVKKERVEVPEKRSFKVGQDRLKAQKNVPVTDPETGEPVRERKWESREDGRVWRVNFYRGFVNRARYRLREARNQALKDAGIDVQDDGDARSLALRDKAKEVREVFEEENRFVLSTGRTYGGAKVSTY